MDVNDIPQEIIDLLDERAGKKHSRDGIVLTTLAEVFTLYDEMRSIMNIDEEPISGQQLVVSANTPERSDVIPIPPPVSSGANSLTFQYVSEMNAKRAARWHGSFPNYGADDFSGGDWANALQGEGGELAEAVQALILCNEVTSHLGLIGNLVKKLRRIELGLNSQNNGTEDELRTKLSKEIGDAYLYLDLTTQYHNLNTGACVQYAFNQVSEREGFPERL